MKRKERALPAGDDAPHPADWTAQVTGQVLPRDQGHLMWWAALRVCTRRDDHGTQALRRARTWHEAQLIAERLIEEEIAAWKARPAGPVVELPF